MTLRRRVIEYLRSRLASEHLPLRLVLRDGDCFDFVDKCRPAVMQLSCPHDCLSGGEAVVQLRSPDRTPEQGGQHPRLRAVVIALDDRLRARHGIIEYTRDPDCIFRLEVIPRNGEHQLSDGARVGQGDRLINLHLWKERTPAFPATGPTLGWARRMCRALDISLRELAFYVANRQDIADVVAICANMTLDSAQQSDQLVRISERFGFERVAVEDSPSVAERMHRLGENILFSMMTLTGQPRGLAGRQPLAGPRPCLPLAPESGPSLRMRAGREYGR